MRHREWRHEIGAHVAYRTAALDQTHSRRPLPQWDMVRDEGVRCREAQATKETQECLSRDKGPSLLKHCAGDL